MQQNKNGNFEFTVGDVEILLDTFRDFWEATAEIYNRYGGTPLDNSIASQELVNFAPVKRVDGVYFNGKMSMESAADHLMSFADLLIEPVKTVAPWTCVRASLEASALACWLLDPSVDVKTRVGRNYAYRYNGFKEQLKFSREVKNQSEIDRALLRMDSAKSEAVSLGYLLVNDKNGKIIGIDQKMPFIIDLIEMTLNRKSDYRLLSAVAHGHIWATHQVGFSQVEIENSEGNKIKALKKSGSPFYICYFGMVSFTSFSRVLYYLWKLFGWDLQELIILLDNAFDRLKYSTRIRFWRMPAGSTW